MNRFFVAATLASLCACATPPKPAALQPLNQTCGEVARGVENGSNNSTLQKRELVEKMKTLVFHWRVRVLSLSDETSRGELANGMAFNVECFDRPNEDHEGLRYLFTLNFDKRVADLAALSRGKTMTVEGSLTSYEGQGAFAGHVTAYSIDQ